jgi:hypothetical protein
LPAPLPFTPFTTFLPDLRMAANRASINCDCLRDDPPAFDADSLSPLIRDTRLSDDIWLPARTWRSAGASSSRRRSS